MGRLLAFLLWVLLSGCHNGGSTNQPPADYHVVVDMAGHGVKVPRLVRRIACLEVLCYEKLFLLGASDRIAMMTKTNAPWMRRTNPSVDHIQPLAADPGIEELLDQHVDVAFHTLGYPAPRKIEKLAEMGVPLLVSQAIGTEKIDSIDAFVQSRDHMLKMFAEVLGPAYVQRAEEWCRYHDRMVAMVRSRTEGIPASQRIRLFHVRGPTANQTQGRSSNTFWYGEIAGADMVIKNSPMASRGGVSIEDILKWNPQVINVGRQYSARLVTGNPKWAQVSAVREGRVHELPEGVFYSDGSTEGVLLMLYIAKELYPDRFADLDLRHEYRNYYARFYRYTLSDTELDLMLQGKGPDGRRFNDMAN
jgi:iron complex transport system substrate-binding protein